MSVDITAPHYAPAVRFHPPKPLPFEPGIDAFTIQELLDSPAGRAILAKHAAWLVRPGGADAFKAYLSVLTLRSVAQYLPMDTRADFAEIDADLRALPQSEWPGNG